MWIVIKVVGNTGAPPIIGCAVGPFETEADAKKYVEGAVIGALGYEDWRVLELQGRNF
jgi:hypothetical protein